VVVGQPGNSPGNGIEPPGPNPNTPRNPDGSPKQPSVSGLGDGVDLGDFGEIKKTSNPAARVKPLDAASGRLQRIYMRAFTYSEFRGGRWTEGTSPAIDLYAVRDGEKRELPRAPGRTGLGWATLSYEIELTRAGVGNKGQVPLPVETRELVDYQGPLQYDARTNMLRAPEMVSGDFFTVNTRTRTLTDAQLATALRGRAVTRVDESLRAYATMPDAVRRGFQARFDRWQELQRIAQGSNRTDPAEQRGVYACAREIVRMFREDKFGERPKWEYSLTLRPMPGEYAIVSFMDTRTTESERFGHCEYFASAMCLLLRSYGIPARLCAGFSCDKKDERGEFVVTTGDAHAWVEVWFEGEGWIAFDPTPPGGPEQPEPVTTNIDEPQPDVPEPVVDKPTAPDDGGGNWIDDFGNKDQSELISSISNTAREWFALGDDFLRGLTGWMPGFVPRSGWLRAALLLLPPLAILLAFALLRVRKGRRERAMIGDAGKGMTRRHRGLYVQLMLLLAKHGYTRVATETPMEFALRVQRQGGPLFESVVPLTRLYYDLRYGAKPGAEERFREQFTEYAQLLRRVVAPPRAAESAA
jgi:transglutaminase-like putative cysteine protease